MRKVAAAVAGGAVAFAAVRLRSAARRMDMPLSELPGAIPQLLVDEAGRLNEAARTALQRGAAAARETERRIDEDISQTEDRG